MPSLVCTFSNHCSSRSHSAVDGSTQHSPDNSLVEAGTEAYANATDCGTNHSNIEHQFPAYSWLICCATPEDTRDDLRRCETALQHAGLMRYDRVWLAAIEALELMYHVRL